MNFLPWIDKIGDLEDEVKRLRAENEQSRDLSINRILEINDLKRQLQSAIEVIEYYSYSGGDNSTKADEFLASLNSKSEGENIGKSVCIHGNTEPMTCKGCK